MCFERIAMDDRCHSFSGLFGPMSVKLDPVPQDARVRGDGCERYAIADAGT